MYKKKKNKKKWLRILKMSPCRLPFKADKMLLQLHEQSKRTWASSICYVLCKYDFGDVWVNQGFGDEKAFLRNSRKEYYPYIDKNGTTV